MLLVLVNHYCTYLERVFSGIEIYYYTIFYGKTYGLMPLYFKHSDFTDRSNLSQFHRYSTSRDLHTSRCYFLCMVSYILMPEHPKRLWYWHYHRSTGSLLWLRQAHNQVFHAQDLVLASYCRLLYMLLALHSLQGKHSVWEDVEVNRSHIEQLKRQD